MDFNMILIINMHCFYVLFFLDILLHKTLTFYLVCTHIYTILYLVANYTLFV